MHRAKGSPLVTRSRILSCAAVLLAASALTLALNASRMTRRIRPGWSWTSSYVGFQTYADPVTGVLPERDVTGLYRYSIGIVAGTLTDDAVTLEDRYAIHDVETNAITYEYLSTARMDPRNGARLEPEFLGSYYLFPRNVERTTYVLRMSYLEGIPLAYANDADMLGLATYHFSYRGPAEYTEAYRGTADYPGVEVPSGQEIRCADDGFRYDAWVEPLTGEIVKIKEGCPTGDYLYAVGSDVPAKAVGRWGGEMAGNDVVARVQAVRAERTRQLLIERAPFAMLLGAATCAVLAWLARPRQDA